jgi:tetratricopeptide (TPR) repeat protein/predicted Ser/Thr protein kinase
VNDRQRYEHIQRLFLEACALFPSERSAFLDRVCADDTTLRAELDRLLKHDAAPLAMIDSAASGAAVARLASGVFASDGDPADPLPLPERIGRYRVIRVIGEGGMGVVYEAEQDAPRRRVALKMLRPGSASPTLLRRFRHEAQILAHLRHPGVAQVFDAGTAPDAGQPFLAMELVDGPPLLQFATDNALTLRQKLELVADICDALHHAHQKGVIHRDLKPGNILVEQRETSSAAGTAVARHASLLSSAQPKILDFGIARITDDALRAATLQTTAGELIGTLPYMSPEQTSGDPAAIDTRSDVYSMGVILFELIAGRLPIEMTQRSMAEAIRAIQADEPTRLRSIDRRIPEDVETIVAKALEKDRSRRYQSAAEFATDIRRFLADEPILARPPSAIYQLRTFARRNRALAVGAAVAAAGLFIAAVASTVLAILAVRAEREQREARFDAELARDEAEAANDFLADMLGAADPDELGRDVRVIDMLAHAAGEIDSRFAEKPAVRAHLHRNIGITYRRLGMLAEAETQLEAAVRDARIAYHRDHPALLRALNSLAVLYDDQGRYHKSVPIYEQVLAIQERTLGRSHRDTLGTSCNLGLTLLDLKRYDEAGRVLDATLADMMRALGPNDRFTINCVQGTGSVHLALGRLEQAAAAFQQALTSASESFGPNDNRAITALASLSDVAMARADPGEAVGFIDDALTRAGVALPPGHWQLARLSGLRAGCLIALQRFDEAEADLQAAHAIYEATFGPSDPATLGVAGRFADLYNAWSKPDMAAQWRAVVDSHQAATDDLERTTDQP